MKCPSKDSNNDISPTFGIILCTHRYKLVQYNMCDVFLTFYPNKYTLHGKQNIDKK